MIYRSTLNDIACKHRHALYREARDCGYKREKRDCIYGSCVVDLNGASITSEMGAALDVATESEAFNTRQEARYREITRLAQEAREQARRARPWL